MVVNTYQLLYSISLLSAAEDAIIQPVACSFDEADEEDIFQIPRKHRMAMNRKSTYEEYCKISKPILMYIILYSEHHESIIFIISLCSDLPHGMTFSVFREFMLSIEVG